MKLHNLFNLLGHAASNLMWTFTALNLHQLPDSKVELNKTNVNNYKCNKLKGLYQGVGDKGVTERLWRIAYGKQLSSELFPEGGNGCGTTYINGKVILNLKAKLRQKYLTDL